MEKKYIRYSLGNDVSKDGFDTCLLGLNSDQTLSVLGRHRFNNAPAGYRDLVKWLRKHTPQDIPLSIVMEATGVYHERLAQYLCDQGFKISIVLPTKAKYYLRSLGLKSKNDRSDAQGLAHLGAMHRLRTWEPPSVFYRELRQLTRHHQSIQEQKNVIGNQLKALHSGSYSSPSVSRQMKDNLRLLNMQECQTKKDIRAHIRTDAEVHRKMRQISTVKGLGMLSVATVVAETAGFSLIENQRQLVSYAGYDVVENRSGKKAGRTTISKKGNSRIRRILYMPSITAATKGAFIPLYDRILKKTEHKKKGLVAVQRKLLVLIYTLWRKDEPFREMETEDRPQQKKNNTKKPEISEEVTSRDRELTPLFQVSRREEDDRMTISKSGTARGSATQDEHPPNRPSDALFQVRQN